jgi:hypothetical protein
MMTRFLMLAALAIMTSGSASAFALFQVTENFNSDPVAWGPDGPGSPNSTAPQDFGWKNSNNAGGGLGEAGGTFSRMTSARYDTSIDDADPTEAGVDPSTDALTMSGRIEVTGGTANPYLGWFSNTALGAAEPTNFIGFRLDTEKLLLNVRANGASAAVPGQDTAVGANNSLANASTFSITYNPNGNGGTGTLTGSINGGASTATINLTAGAKDLMADLGRFGMFTRAPGTAPQGMAFFDDLVYTSTIPEPAFFSILSIGAVLGQRRPRQRILRWGTIHC